MARLDAAARFTPALTKLATDAACEPATTVDAQIVQPAVIDRENAADEARSRFSMISDKSVFSHRKCRSMALHTKPSVQMSDTKIDVRNRILAGNFGGKAPSRPEVVQTLEPDSGCQVHGIRLVLATKLFQASSSKTSNWPLLLPDQRKPRLNSRRSTPVCRLSGAVPSRF
jgi:hypothetical protein